MKLETKYNIGDEVYRTVETHVFEDDKMKRFTERRGSVIRGIGVYVNRHGKIRNTYFTDTFHGAVAEDELSDTLQI